MSEHDADRKPQIRSSPPEPRAAARWEWLDALMTILSLAWTVLLVLELVRGLPPFEWWLGPASGLPSRSSSRSSSLSQAIEWPTFAGSG
jgi:hypothetical protein